MTSNTRAQRLVDEFDEGSWTASGAYSIRHGIAAVLRHLTATAAQYGDMESECAVPVRVIEDVADALDAPTLMERAMAGDAAAARQFLRQAGFTDEHGQWLPQYQPTPEATND